MELELSYEHRQPVSSSDLSMFNPQYDQFRVATLLGAKGGWTLQVFYSLLLTSRIENTLNVVGGEIGKKWSSFDVRLGSSFNASQYQTDYTQTILEDSFYAQEYYVKAKWRINRSFDVSLKAAYENILLTSITSAQPLNPDVDYTALTVLNGSRGTTSVSICGPVSGTEEERSMNEHTKGTTASPPGSSCTRECRLVALALVFGALYVFGRREGSPDASGLKINHKFKMDTVGLSCDACHEPNSSNPRLMSFPNHDTCAACHADAIDQNSAKKNCELCHTQPDYKTNVRKDQVLSPLVKFDHQPHQKSGVDCAKCHTVFDKDILTGDEMLPSMDTCVKCHADQKVKGGTDCNFCHVKGLEKIKPQTHDAAWKIVHGKGLTKDLIDSNCKVCHTRELGNSCTKCHHQAPLTFGKTVACSTCHGAGFDTTRPKDHTPLWVTSHGKGLTQVTDRPEMLPLPQPGQRERLPELPPARGAQEPHHRVGPEPARQRGADKQAVLHHLPRPVRVHLVPHHQPAVHPHGVVGVVRLTGTA